MVSLENLLSSSDAARAARALQKLARHGIGCWVLTGGLAVEIHQVLSGGMASIRRLHDIDFVCASFDDLPETLARDYLFRHVHPFDPPNKTILQAIDAEHALRIDVFRTGSGCVDRACRFLLAGQSIRLISLADLTARMGRLAMDLSAGVPVPVKHARDFLRLTRLVDEEDIQAAWQEHRRPNHPARFADANGLLRELIAKREDLLVTPAYSTDVHTICRRCAPTASFQLMEAERMVRLLGYC